MARRELKVTRIGNSRGIRLPADTLKRYRISGSLIMEERSDGILLRVPGSAVPKLGWADTAQAMAAEAENRRQWDTATADGLAALPWESKPARRVAESPKKYNPRAGRARKR